jgi:hypothetical protein
VLGRKAAASTFVCLVALAGASCTHAQAPAASPSVSPETSAPEGASGDVADPDDDADAEPEVENVATDTAPCPENMALVAPPGSEDRAFCIDKWEASLVEVATDGSEKPYPHYLPVDGHAVRAVSEPGVFPQGYVSELQAEDSCAASGKRLCVEREWKVACMGPTRTTFPYGADRRPGVCHDTGRSAVVAVFGAKAVAASPVPQWMKKKKGTGAKSSAKAKNKSKKPPSPARSSGKPASVEASVWTQLNNPLLGQVDGALARTGDHEGCVNGFGVYDMVGNIHEWVHGDARRTNGTFAGGYYLDTAKNGDGCNYRTTAHAHDYHDYSTGFRCCSDPSSR